MNNYPIIMLISAASGLFVSILTASGVLWRASAIETRLTVTMSTLGEEVKALRETRDEHIKLLADLVARVAELKGRVDRGGL